ncbi:MAG TPA: DNA gyrase subunit B, partial [Spirochaetota bacterium]|nr:DNA gyrase subunit B [Spirochaetota bacterium]
MSKRKFRKLSNVEHVRLRTGMWLGQNSDLTYEQHFFNRSGNNFKVVHEEITDVPAKMKCFDEVVMNCVDEYNKNIHNKSIRKKNRMNFIKVELSDNKKRIS